MRTFPVIATLPLVMGALLLGGQPVAAQDLGGELLSKPGRVVQLGPGATELPPLMARTWIIADATTGEVLAAKGAHRTRAPASTMKMLTALTVLPKLPLESTTVARVKAVNMYGSRVGLVKGRSYTIEQLMNAMMLPSANDAAVALAQANGGIKRTVVQMNELAEQLQARNTEARNPSGLDAPGQQSTAYDLALIARAGLAQPTFAEFVKRTRAEFPKQGKKKRKMRTIYSTNRLLLGNYPGVIGVKTGFTSNAGRTFVGAATRNGRTLIVSFMGVRERTDVAAAKLLTWGFANADKVTPIGVLVDPVTAVAADVEPEGGGAQPVPVQTPVEVLPVESDITATPASTQTQPTMWVAIAAAIGMFLIAAMVLGLRARAVRQARHVARR